MQSEKKLTFFLYKKKTPNSYTQKPPIECNTEIEIVSIWPPILFSSLVVLVKYNNNKKLINISTIILFHKQCLGLVIV